MLQHRSTFQRAPAVALRRLQCALPRLTSTLQASRSHPRPRVTPSPNTLEFTHTCICACTLALSRAVAHVHTMAPMPTEAHYQTTCLLAYSCSPWYCHPIRPRRARHIALVHAPSSRLIPPYPPPALMSHGRAHACHLPLALPLRLPSCIASPSVMSQRRY